MDKLTVTKRFDWFSEVVLLIFLCVVMGYGPDNHRVFIPAEILFVLTFSIRFLVKRYKLTSLVSWSLAFLVLSVISVFYANDKVLAFSRVKSILQVLVFANLIMPHISESKQSFKTFVYVYLLASLFVISLAIFSSSLSIVSSVRMGEHFGVNPNTIGYMFSIAVIIILYLFFENRNWLLFFPFMVFLIFSLLSGSRSVFILLSVGCVALVLLYQKTLKRAFFAALVAVLAVIVCVILIITIEPLYRVIGKRFVDMLMQLGGAGTDESTSIRMGMVINGFEMFKQKPLFGWGLGAFTDLGGYEMYAHNNYVELLVAVGLFGTILYYAIPFYIVIRGIKRFFRFQEKGPYILATTLMVTMIIDQVARVTYTEEFSNILIALCYAGIVLDDPEKGLDVFQFFTLLFDCIRHPSKIVYFFSKRKEKAIKPKCDT